MRVQVMHSCPIDFNFVQKGDVYSTYCGKRFIAEDSPTPEEAKEIEQNFTNARQCKRCIASKAKIQLALSRGAAKKL